MLAQFVLFLPRQVFTKAAVSFFAAGLFSNPLLVPPLRRKHGVKSFLAVSRVRFARNEHDRAQKGLGGQKGTRHEGCGDCSHRRANSRKASCRVQVPGEEALVATGQIRRRLHSIASSRCDAKATQTLRPNLSHACPPDEPALPHWQSPSAPPKH